MPVDRDSAASRSLPARPRPARTALVLAWAALRLPVLLAVAWILRDGIADHVVGRAPLTRLAIHLLGTPGVRLLLFLALGAALASLCFTALRRWPAAGYRIAILAAAALTIGVFLATSSALAGALVPIAVLATNLLPDRFFDRLLPGERVQGAFLAAAVGIAELCFLRRHLAWIARRWTGRPAAAAGTLPAVLIAAVLASATASAVVSSARLVPLEQSLRMPPSARVVARGDFNWIELDASRRHLLVTGHGVPRLLRFDVTDFARAPQAASVATGRAQAFAYDAAADEIDVYHRAGDQIRIFDAGSMELERSLPVPDLASGDPWIVADHATDSIVVVSEADTLDGVPFQVLDRTTGEARDRRAIDAGNVLLVGEKSRLYLSFFRRRSGLMAYDLATAAVQREVPAPRHADRMAYVAASDEVLLAVPSGSQIVRYDAETLARKGAITSIFGGRTLAVDAERGLLLCGSLVTGEVAVIDLATSRIVSRDYLGPWLRTIAVDSGRAVAYVSSNGALYELRYGPSG